MTLTTCVWSDKVRKCGYSFTYDGHVFCVSHRPCVSLDYVYDPFGCDVCRLNVTFLQTKGVVDRNSPQFISIKTSWDAVRRAARRKKLFAYWANEVLQSFLFAKTCSAKIPVLPVTDTDSFLNIGGGTEFT